jgi:hypothetical protein
MFISPAFAQADSSNMAGVLTSFAPLIIIVIVLLVVWSVPSRRAKKKQRYDLLRQQVGDQIVIKTYKGKESEATQDFQYDAIEMAERGYFPTSQSWAPGQYSAGAYIAAVLFIFFSVLASYSCLHAYC